MEWSAPPTAIVDLSAALRAVQSAAQAGDNAAVTRRFRRLDSALRAHHGLLFRKAAGLCTEDLHQKLLMRLHRYFGQKAARPIDQPRAWLKTTAQNLVNDELRVVQRARSRHSDEDLDSPRVTEQSGVFVSADFLLELKQEQAALEAAIVEYARRAISSSPRAQTQIWAVYYERLCGEAATRVAELLQARGLGTGTPATIHQWACRGQRLLERLCAEDEDRERAALVRSRLSEAGRRAVGT